MRNTLINISITRKVALSLAILMSFCLVFTVACGSNAQAPSSAVPTWKIGDTWTVRSSVNGSEITSVTTVTGQEIHNGIDCYTLQMNSTPSRGISTMTLQVDKTTLDVVGMEMTGSMDGADFTVTANASYDYSVKPYPLSVGKTWTYTENTTTTTLVMGQTQTETETYSYNYKVASVENITVPAGTFECFKVVQYNSSTNAVLDTQWATDRMNDVKEIAGDGGVTSELVSYSLSK